MVSIRGVLLAALLTGLSSHLKREIRRLSCELKIQLYLRAEQKETERSTQRGLVSSGNGGGAGDPELGLTGVARIDALFGGGGGGAFLRAGASVFTLDVD